MEKKNEQKKRALNISKYFLVIMIGLTFFSQTIHYWMLPKVHAEPAVSGHLYRTVRLEGAAEAVQTEGVYVNGQYFVTAINKRPGDELKKGDIICQIDQKDIQNKLEAIELEMRLLENEKQQSLLKYKKALETQNHDLQEELERYRQEAQMLDHELHEQKVLLEAGAIAQNLYEDKLTKRDDIEAEIWRIKNQIEGVGMDHFAIQQQNLERERIQLNMDVLEKRSKELHNLLESGGIVAQSAGRLVSVDVETGERTSTNMPVAVIATSIDQMQIEMTANDPYARLLEPGTLVKGNTGRESWSGTIESIYPTEASYYTVRLLVNQELALNETYQTTIDVDLGMFETIVPVYAVQYDDQDRPFVFTIQTEPTTFGEVSKVEKHYVQVGERNLEHVGIVEGLQHGARVVYRSDRSLKEGSEVAIQDSEDW